MHNFPTVGEEIISSGLPKCSGLTMQINRHRHDVGYKYIRLGLTISARCGFFAYECYKEIDADRKSDECGLVNKSLGEGLVQQQHAVYNGITATLSNRSEHAVKQSENTAIGVISAVHYIPGEHEVRVAAHKRVS